MKTRFGAATVALGIVLLGTAFAGRASAQCGYLEGSGASASFEQAPSSWRGQARLMPASLASVPDRNPSCW